MPEKTPSLQPQLSHTIEQALHTFLCHHKEHLPNNLHELAIHAVEKPLLKLIMAHTDHNQSETAKFWVSIVPR